MPPKIFTIIVNYHCQDLIQTCIDSLKALNRTDLGYIVIDNSNFPDTDRIEIKYPEAVILRPGSNIGFGGGVKAGMEYVLGIGASYILLLNPDTRSEHDFLNPLLLALKENPTTGIVGPKILKDEPGRAIWSAGGKLNWWLGRPANVLDDRYSTMGKIMPVPFLSGCAMLLRAQAVRQVGLMDDRYFLYFEDADYVQRFLCAGWGVAYVPEAEILHAPSSTTGFQSENYVYYFSRNRIWFMQRWARWYHYLVFMAFNTMVKLPGAIIVFGLMRRRPRLVRAFFRGYIDGLRPIPEIVK
jgi:GT2 family glycosyltransferase